MAYNNYNNYSEPATDTDVGKGMFNEAIFVVRRLSDLQTQVNNARLNPLAFNIEHGVYNYQIWFSSLTSLMSETWAKLSDDEKKDAETIRALLNKALISFPPHKIVNKIGVGQETSFIKENWNIIESGLMLFEKKIKSLMDTHGLGNPNIEGEGMF